MKGKFKFKHFLYLFITNLIIFVILYMNIIYPIKKNYSYNTPILHYHVKTDISNLSTEINNIFNDIGLNNILYYFDKEVFISSSTTYRRNRANANISLKAKYKDDNQKENIKTVLKSLNLKEQFSSDKKYIEYNNTTSIYIDTFNKDSISLVFGTSLPYSAIKDLSNDDPFVDFHLEINKVVKNIVENQLKCNYIIILALLITINLTIQYIIFLFKSKTQNQNNN